MIFPGQSGPFGDPNVHLAKCGQLSIHDLRRTWISIANAIGIPSWTIKALVNHKPGADDITGRHYIGHEDDDLRAAAQRVADRIDAMCGTNVVPLIKRIG